MIDARGQACPIPVIMVQKAVKNNSPAEIEVLVDNKTAMENVSRFAGNQGYHVEVKTINDEEYQLTLKK